MNEFVQGGAESAPAPEPALSAAQKRIHSAAMKLFAEMDVTRVSISDLAAAAGVARGTVYNNLGDTEGLFEQVAAQLVREMTIRVTQSLAGTDDLALRLALGIRHYLRRAHEEPHWGRFLNRFGFSSASLQTLWSTDPIHNLSEGIEAGRYRITREQLPSAVAMLAGTVIAAMLPVLEGHRTWREIGADTAELLLVALGIARDEAKVLANSDLPPLLTLDK
ncbi:TetR/AcrR family transcriptional regulator [Cupriavidus sp. IK-TO18]|uniref:TetR/AcrR family transcriptional regulator n=1 Tax=Cupriavidus sp. IK-TO18 TaxID=2782182 RepID=UPI00189906B9|nr:TetR/AcrR family transcriptional regulator [Cupriavidus sp. IK-TO18]MBF6989600.1 TetR/AcrR family transcriptional regulator [Cupriavidus sp. IK-TO18]